MAIAILEELWTRIRAAIDDKIVAATDARDQAVAAATNAAADRTHVDSQVEAIDTAFTESIPPYLQMDAPGGLRTFVRSEMRSMGPGTLTDHTQAIQSNLDAIAAGGGGVLLLLPGNYKITAMIKMPPKVSLRGSGEFATHINATGLPTGSTAIHMTPGSTATSLTDMSLTGSPNRNSNGLHIGRLPADTGGAVADFIVSNVRFDTFDTGITGTFAWCGKFVNVRVHSCLTGMQLGPQVNALSCNVWLTSFVNAGAVLTNAENITFDTASIESTVSTGSALSLFQSHAVLIQPYVEHISKLAQVGAASEAERSKSSLVTVNGRLCGTIMLGGSGTRVTVTSPWLMESAPGTPLAIDMAEGNLGRQPRQIRVDAQPVSRGIQTVTKWDARGDTWPFANAYGGAGVTAVRDGDFYTATSPSAAQGIRLGTTEIGQQYVLSYRARKTDGNLNLRDGAGNTYAAGKVEAAGSDFEVVHTPFIARDTTLRMLWAGNLDLQWVSLTKGLNFLDRS